MLSTILCPAKINLFLHILGKRDDGYHILESLVSFADFGDDLTFYANEELLTLEISGTYSSELSKCDIADNLIIKAAERLAKHYNITVSGRFSLVKNLPVASGIGGGSSNAAAAIKLLMRQYELTEDNGFNAMLLALGADVPVCYRSQSTIMSGIGEGLQNWRNLPKLYTVLVNPNEAVSTAKIFSKLSASKEIGRSKFVNEPQYEFNDTKEFVDFLISQTNHMQQAAIDICPTINIIIEALSALNGNMMSRMSGSGATCFGIFESEQSAQIAAKSLTKKHLSWWVKPCSIGP